MGKTFLTPFWQWLYTLAKSHLPPEPKPYRPGPTRQRRPHARLSRRK